MIGGTFTDGHKLDVVAWFVFIFLHVSLPVNVATMRTIYDSIGNMSTLITFNLTMCIILYRYDYDEIMFHDNVRLML